MTSGQVGMLLWLLAQAHMQTLNQRVGAVALFLGVMRAGVGVVTQSAFGDLFAFQPEISASIQASDGIWANFGSFTGLSLGALVRATAGDTACFYISAVLAVLQAILIASIPETLDRRDRKQIHSVGALLLQANPVSSLMLLFRNGPVGMLHTYYMGHSSLLTNVCFRVTGLDGPRICPRALARQHPLWLTCWFASAQCPRLESAGPSKFRAVYGSPTNCTATLFHDAFPPGSWNLRCMANRDDRGGSWVRPGRADVSTPIAHGNWEQRLDANVDGSAVWRGE